MRLFNYFIIPFILTTGFFPMYLNSADIYETSTKNDKIITSLNKNIVLNSNKGLSSTFFILQTNDNKSNLSLKSSCNIDNKIISKISDSNKTIYIIKTVYFNKNCKDNKIYIKNGETIYTDSIFNLNITNYSSLINKYTNYSDNDLKDLISNNKTTIHSLDNEIFSLKNKKDIGSKLSIIEKTYKMNYAEYESEVINTILKERKNLKYSTPVAGKTLPTSKNLIPNAPRTYRKDVTDGIHHGYDILAPRGTPVQALANGIVIRVVKSFSWNDFGKIKKGNITKEDKLMNLDTYRGNQVWLKTFDGNIIFYSHLDKIPDYLYEGKLVKTGDYFGNIDKTGVPDKEYKDYHLHFEIQLNPHTKKDYYSNLDIMKWKFFGQGDTKNQIIALQSNMFF